MFYVHRNVRWFLKQFSTDSVTATIHTCSSRHQHNLRVTHTHTQQCQHYSQHCQQSISQRMWWQRSGVTGTMSHYAASTEKQHHEWQHSIIYHQTESWYQQQATCTEDTTTADTIKHIHGPRRLGSGWDCTSSVCLGHSSSQCPRLTFSGLSRQHRPGSCSLCHQHYCYTHHTNFTLQISPLKIHVCDSLNNIYRWESMSSCING